MRLYSDTVTCHSAAVADANGTIVDCSGLAAVAFQISGTLTNVVLYFEGTIDGSTWVSILAKNVASGAIVTSSTAAGVFVCDCIGLSQARCRLDWTSGSVDVVARGVAAAIGLNTALLPANSGVDIGDVTINNAAGSGAYVQPGTSTTWDVSDRAARLAGVVTVSPASSVVHGKKTVSAAGTEEALGASTPLTYGVRIKALAANTNNVYVGANPVTSTTGFVLDAGEEVFIEVANLATVYIDVDTNGEGVTYIGG